MIHIQTNNLELNHKYLHLSLLLRNKEKVIRKN